MFTVCFLLILLQVDLIDPHVVQAVHIEAGYTNKNMDSVVILLGDESKTLHPIMKVSELLQYIFINQGIKYNNFQTFTT